MGGSVPEIPGIKAEGDLLAFLQGEVARLLGRKQTNFPGAQPVSFAARHIAELQKNEYFLCEKTDGLRLLMYLTRGDQEEEVVYLIDRKNDYYHVNNPNLHFPLPGDDISKFHAETLVDGELVLDSLRDGRQQLKYLVFDCLILDGKSYMHRTLDRRLGYFNQHVLEPYKALLKKYPEEVQYMPFLVEFKHQEFSYAMEKMFQEILPSLPHGNDGLIFTCRSTPYQHGTDPHILKWKPEEENSIDFVLHLEFPVYSPGADGNSDADASPFPDYSAMPKFLLGVSVGDHDQMFGEMFAEEQEWETLKSRNEPLNDRVVECYLDKQRRWRYLRFRDDKHGANHISTVESVMESIQDQVSRLDLIGAQAHIRAEWKKREAEAKKQAATNGHK